MNIVIEKMNQSHLEKIKDIMPEQFDEFWTANVLEKELQNSLSSYIVALYNDEVVGYAGIWKPIDEAHITNIVVKKDKRGKHIGTQLLKELINMAQKKNLQCITLEGNVKNENAIKLYKKYNFEEVGRRKKYYNNIDDAIIMTLKLQT